MKVYLQWTTVTVHDPALARNLFRSAPKAFKFIQVNQLHPSKFVIIVWSKCRFIYPTPPFKKQRCVSKILEIDLLESSVQM